MALDLVTRIFCDPGDVVLVEAPSYVGALGVFRSYQVDVRHVAMDDKGLVPEALTEALAACRTAGQTVKFIYTIPSYHNPAGDPGPDPARADPADRPAGRGPGPEDDPYGLPGFDGEVPQAIRAMDSQSVIYLGSFSKTIAAGLRVGWAVAPHAVREKLVLAAEAAILCPSNFSQLTVRSICALSPGWIRSRRSASCTGSAGRPVDRHGAVVPTRDELDGSHRRLLPWVTLPEGIDATAMLPRAVSALVAYVPGTGFYTDGQGRDSMRLSYCYPPPERISEGVRRLAGVIEEELDLIQYSETPRPSYPGPGHTGPDLA